VCGSSTTVQTLGVAQERIKVLITTVAIVRIDSTYTTLATESPVVEPEGCVLQIRRYLDRQTGESSAIIGGPETRVETIDSIVGIVGRETGCSKERLDSSMISLSEIKVHGVANISVDLLRLEDKRRVRSCITANSDHNCFGRRSGRRG